MLVVALVVLWCTLACAAALVVGRSVGVADAETRAATAAFALVETPGPADPEAPRAPAADAR